VTTTKRLLGTKPKAQAGCKKTFEYQTQGPGRMAKMCQAGTVNSACRNPCYRCSMMSNHQGNHSMRCTFLTRLLPPPDIRELSEAPLSLFVVFFLGWRIPKLRWGWVFLKQTRILSRLQFTRYFIEFVFLETERFVSSNPNVILTQQTCGQRSSRAAGSKRRALTFYFSIRICYVFLMSECIGESDLGLCTSSVFAKRIPLRGGDFRLKNVFGRKFCWKLPMHCGILFASTEVVHRPRSGSPLHFDIRNI